MKPNCINSDLPTYEEIHAISPYRFLSMRNWVGTHAYYSLTDVGQTCFITHKPINQRISDCNI